MQIDFGDDTPTIGKRDDDGAVRQPGCLQNDLTGEEFYTAFPG